MAALIWIGDRSLPIEDATREAQADPEVSQYVEWGLAAIGYGYGDGSGSGYGSGDGSGYGDG